MQKVIGALSKENEQKEFHKYWELEGIGIHENPVQNDDKVAMEHFQKTCTRDSDGRYVVSWPLKDENVKIKNNFWGAISVLKSVHKKLMETKRLNKYNEMIMTQINEGILEIIDNDGKENSTLYIPHHPVYNKEKDKLRIVFNASFKTKGSNSLNDLLYRGPVLLPELVGCLMRFRMSKIVAIADVQKAFHQIAIAENQRDLTRCFWLKDIEGEVVESNVIKLRFKRMAFGVISAPFLMTASINDHLEKTNTKLSLELKNGGMYADNIFLFANSTQELRDKCEQSKEIFAQIKMNLHEFFSNDLKINKAFSEQHEKKIIKVLGINWNLQEDEIFLELSKNENLINENMIWTKRKVLKQLAKTFDPLGYLIPVSLPRKLIMQEIWKNDIDWDEKLSPELNKKWNELMQQNNEENMSLKIKRETFSPEEEIEIHIFVDASKDAYCAAAYLKCGENIKIILAKNRLSPLKNNLTIPRLELLAAVAGKRLVEYIKNQIKTPFKNVYVWSDSKCILYWIISSKLEKLPKFVRRRLEEIRGQKEIIWRYVPTQNNPADLGTRGCTMEELKNNKLWWEGPSFLKDMNQWPPIEMKAEEESQDENELDKLMACVLMGEINLKVRNKWDELVTIATYFLKFITKIGKRIDLKSEILCAFKNAESEAKERKIAQLYLLRQAQLEFPPDKKTQIDYLLKQDKYSLWKCWGRLENSASTPPIWMPKESKIAELICMEAHRKCLHSGLRASLAELREKFWITKGRAFMKKVIEKCEYCSRLKLKAFEIPPMAPLPKERVNKSNPFQFCGIDYFGPYNIRKANKEIGKIYVVIFVCESTRAIHLEMVNDLTANNCIMALRRFFAEYGKPTKILSDNGTQLKLTSKVVKEITKFSTKETIEWTFIPSLSPRFGAFYERIIGIVKPAMKAATGKRLLESEEFRTLLAEVKKVVNSRPLTYVYNEPGDNVEVLTPMKAIQPNRNKENFDIDFERERSCEREKPEEKLTRIWKNSREAVEMFWKRWNKEYLQYLRERADKYKHNKGKNYVPEKGEIVLLQDKSLPKNLWNLAKIIETIKGKDNIVRVAKVLCKGKILTRAIDLLYPLELKAECEEKIIDKNQKIGTKMHEMKLRTRKKINYKESDLESDVSSEIEMNLCPFLYERRNFTPPKIERIDPNKNRIFTNKQKFNWEKEGQSLASKIQEEIKEIPEIESKLESITEEIYGIKNKINLIEPLKEEINKLKLENNNLKQDYDNLKILAERNRNDMNRLIADIYKSPEKMNTKCQNSKKQNSRKNSKNKFLNTSVFLMSLVLILFILMGRSVGAPCQKGQRNVLVKSQTCATNGLKIMKAPDGNFCWEIINCDYSKKEHFESENCNVPCKCPQWTETCSFYNGPSTKNSTIKNKNVQKILESLALEKCEKIENCGPLKLIEVNQIQLFDNSLHIIKEMKIEEKQALPEEYECIGTGPITGSPKYCLDHICELHGTKFCYYPGNEISLLVNDNGNIALKAWGRVKIKVRGFLERKENLKCEKCHVECHKEGVKIFSQEEIGSVEICVKNDRCALFPHPKLEELIPLSKEILVSNYEIKIKFWRYGELVKESGINCEAKVICEIIKCNICIELLKNPQCASKTAIILFAIIFYIFFSIIMTVFRVIVFGFRGAFCLLNFKFRLMRWIYRKYNIKSNRGKNEESELKLIKAKREINPIKLTIVLIFLTIPESLQLTTITAQEEKCVVNKNKERTCLFEKVIELNFLPREQEIKILFEDHANRPAGMINLKILNAEARCAKKTKFFTREYEMNVMSVKRCPETGSCKGNKCAEIKVNETILELEAVQNFPGITGCVEGMNNWPMTGCFYATAPCTFYRYYAKPIGNEIFEVFECEKWDIALNLNVSLTKNDGKGEFISESFEVNLIPQFMKEWNKLKMSNLL
ncbi:unnamed protein product [Meloidogyne enterolobii]|uniref:Uncharacterized protein n=1 Tax=Meloidogyne enterolobii TaxID=390850 RepID=A0ACB0XNE1_MELEN